MSEKVVVATGRPSGADNRDQQALQRLLESALLQDRPRLAALAARCHRSGAVDHRRSETEACWQAFERQLAASLAVVAQRQLPPKALALPDALPITACRAQIETSVKDHQVVIICGSTGSGKSTQLPKIGLALGRGIYGRIGLTQPRRLAARAIATRLASELTEELGGVVGFQTRFEQQLTPATRVKVMTDGILLQELSRDRLLLAYDLLIIDEVHERSLNIDFLLGYLRTLLPRRPDLKLILTSATLEAERCAAFFDKAAIVEVPGRSFPVSIRYRSHTEATDSDPAQEILNAIAALDEEDFGDILVFLPGEREIAEVGDALSKARLANTVVLPLYARLTAREQQRVFAPHATRHVVLATNVAETSLTVPGVRHVIDSGLVRLSAYSPRSKLQRLPIVHNSQASAAQRAGRCGRERPGICIRLFSEEDHAARPAHTPPELLRSNLAGVILRLADLGLGAIERFSFLDPPDQRAMNDGYTLLRELGALEANNRLTARGRQLARLPLDPRLGSVLLASAREACVAEALVIVSALSVGDVREWPRDRRQAADEAHAADADRRSEFRWFLKAWQALQVEFKGSSRRQQQSFCRARFWSWRRAREWLAVHTQLATAARELKLHVNEESASYRAVHTALLAGFASRIGRLNEDKRYQGTRGSGFRLHPTSSLRAAPPRWVLAAELTETTAAYARITARIEPAWVSRAVGDLVRRSYSEPRWDIEGGRVVAREEQSLLSLVLSADGVVDYAAVDRVAARQIFIDAALVQGELGAAPAFLTHNLALIANVTAWEERVRRHDLLADSSQLHAFYAERLPPPICSRRELLGWLKAAPGRDHELLMSESDVTRENRLSLARHLFPDVLGLPGMQLRLSYRFEPGDEADGVSVDVPAAVLHQISAAQFDRLVPGLLRDRIHGLLKALPKAQRRAVSPINAFAASLAAAVEGGVGPLGEHLGAEILRMTGQHIDPVLWREAELPDHLRMRYRIIGIDGQVLAAGRDLSLLAREQARAARAAFSRVSWESTDVSTGGWAFGRLPEQVSRVVDGHEVLGYPAIRGGSADVRIEVLADPVLALGVHRDGVADLLMLSAPKETKALRRRVAACARLGLQARALGWRVAFDEWLLHSAFLAAVGAEPPRDEAGFAALLLETQRTIGSRLEAGIELVQEIFTQALEVQRAIEAAGTRLHGELGTDLREQLAELTGPEGLAQVFETMPPRLMRFLRGMALRLGRLLLDPEKDRRKLAQLKPLLARCSALRERLAPEQSQRLSQLLQEMRIASFAPELRTAEPVSVARIETLLESLVMHDDRK